MDDAKTAAGGIKTKYGVIVTETTAPLRISGLIPVKK
jgi:hypothetical protein